MAYKLKIKKAALKELEKLQPGVRKSVDEKLERLKDEMVVVVVKIGSRGDVYKAGGG